MFRIFLLFTVIISRGSTVMAKGKLLEAQESLTEVEDATYRLIIIIIEV